MSAFGKGATAKTGFLFPMQSEMLLVSLSQLNNWLVAAFVRQETLLHYRLSADMDSIMVPKRKFGSYLVYCLLYRKL